MITIPDNSSSQTTTKLPPKSRSPKLIQTMQSIVNPIYALEKSQQLYGDIYLAEFNGFPSQIVLSNTEAIEALFTADAKLFEIGSGSKVIEPLLGANSLVLLDGELTSQR